MLYSQIIKSSSEVRLIIQDYPPWKAWKVSGDRPIWFQVLLQDMTGLKPEISFYDGQSRGQIISDLPVLLLNPEPNSTRLSRDVASRVSSCLNSLPLESIWNSSEYPTKLVQFYQWRGHVAFLWSNQLLCVITFWISFFLVDWKIRFFITKLWQTFLRTLAVLVPSMRHAWVEGWAYREKSHQDGPRADRRNEFSLFLERRCDFIQQEEEFWGLEISRVADLNSKWISFPGPIEDIRWKLSFFQFASKSQRRSSFLTMWWSADEIKTIVIRTSRMMKIFWIAKINEHEEFWVIYSGPFY